MAAFKPKTFTLWNIFQGLFQSLPAEREKCAMAKENKENHSDGSQRMTLRGRKGRKGTSR